MKIIFRLFLVFLLINIARAEALNDTVTVPPNHKVVVVYPSPSDKAFLTESGLTVIDLGEKGASGRTYKDLNQIFKETKTSILWIIQSPLLSAHQNAGTLDKFIKSIDLEKSKYDDVSQIAVFPLEASSYKDVMKQFKDIGFGVYYSAEDGACFVEVHKPSGEIKVGMPGAAFHP